MGVVSRVLRHQERGVRRQWEASWEGRNNGHREAGCMGFGRNPWGVIIVPGRYALPLSTVAWPRKAATRDQVEGSPLCLRYRNWEYERGEGQMRYIVNGVN
jgi:hypothetical protein